MEADEFANCCEGVVADSMSHAVLAKAPQLHQRLHGTVKRAVCGRADRFGKPQHRQKIVVQLDIFPLIPPVNEGVGVENGERVGQIRQQRIDLLVQLRVQNSV